MRCVQRVVILLVALLFFEVIDVEGYVRRLATLSMGTGNTFGKLFRITTYGCTAPLCFSLFVNMTSVYMGKLTNRMHEF